MAPSPSPPPPPSLELAALEALGGALLLVDEGHRVMAATPEALARLGAAFRPGRTLDEVLGSAGHPAPGLREVALGEGAGCRGWVVLLGEAPEEPGGAEETFHGMWTRAAEMKRLFRLVEKVARTESSVLVRGESGTGKELVANALHALSPRHKGPFRALNCAALPPSLLESELFGHVRGAFTGAVRDSPGHFRLADTGTLFLDEVGEFPLELQGKLLRVLETRTVIPVGGRAPVPVDVRIVAATHRALRREVEAGRFRADLMYRLRVVPLFLPSLRERPEDILPLAGRFLGQLERQGSRHVERIAPGARRRLQGHDWPGNVRELRNVMEYAAVMGEGPVLHEADLPPEFSEARPPPARPGPSAHEPCDAERVRAALERAGGNRTEAARLLGISRVTLWRRLRAQGEAPPR